MTDQHFVVTPDTSPLLRSPARLKRKYAGYTDAVSLRHSHDSVSRCAFFFEGKVSVCDDLAFSSEHVIKHRHTANLKRDLGGLIDKIVEHLAIRREAQESCIDCHYKTDVTGASADHEITEVHRRDLIGA